jgi:hypothetical protein
MGVTRDRSDTGQFEIEITGELETCLLCERIKVASKAAVRVAIDPKFHSHS